MRLLIDMDDVIADTLNYTITCLEHHNILINKERLIGKNLEDILTEQQINIMHNITNTDHFFRNIPIKKDCYRVLDSMRRRYQIRVVSSAFVFPESMNAKYWWIKNKLDFLAPAQVIFCGCKSDIMGDIMIDDLVTNLDSFTGEGYIYTAPCNTNLMSKYKRLNSWQDIEDEFLK